MTHDAITALFRELGIAETVRFLQQFSLGRGDYTRERREFLEGQSLDEIVREIRQGGAGRAPGPDRG